MAITDMRVLAEQYARWAYEPIAVPGSITDFTMYEGVMYDDKATPSKTTIKVTPALANTAIQVLRNGTEFPQTQTVKFSEKKTLTTKTTTTEGIKNTQSTKIGTKFSMGFKLEWLTGGFDYSTEVTSTGEYNFTTATEHTTSNESLWEVTQPVTVPPNSKVTAVLYIYETSFNVDFDLEAKIRGTKTSPIPTYYEYFSVKYKRKSDNRNVTVWFDAANLYDTKWPGKPSSFVGREVGGYYPLYFKGKGASTVRAGLYTEVEFRQEPLSGSSGEKKIWRTGPMIAPPEGVLPSGDLGDGIQVVN
ncbi:ETX/MTX2 family pore-forming toxin [Bacillus cereus group sp. BfR-BA-01349]|uniref:ETX/MTX2 family pore-forming toxin n=1 Tax=Bacillus cereus group sp. BfR-BA-01349 TaxID=2920312 RepID=UPI001F5A7859